MPLSPSIYVMALRHAAVLRNAGSYVLSPVSAAPALICLRSVARIAPSLIGTSYCLPVRLSVIVSVSIFAREDPPPRSAVSPAPLDSRSARSEVSGIAGTSRSARALVIGLLVLVHVRVLLDWLGRHAIATVDPPRKILKLAALAAERNPVYSCRLASAKDACASRHGYILLAGRWSR